MILVRGLKAWINFLLIFRLHQRLYLTVIGLRKIVHSIHLSGDLFNKKEQLERFPHLHITQVPLRYGFIPHRGNLNYMQFRLLPQQGDFVYMQFSLIPQQGDLVYMRFSLVPRQGNLVYTRFGSPYHVVCKDRTGIQHVGHVFNVTIYATPFVTQNA